MWILPFWIMGMISLRKRFKEIYPFYTVFSVLIFFILCLHAIPRFRNTFYPVMLFFSSYGIINWWDKSRKHRIWIAAWFLANFILYFISEPVRHFIKNIIS
jgi:hypothetical protein